MDKLLEKISSYNLFNYLLCGVAYVVLCNIFTDLNLIQDNIVLGLFFYYFIGLVISRIGSLIIQTILVKFKLIEFSHYNDYITASKKDEKIDVLSESNNVYRTLSSTFLSVIFTKIYIENWSSFNSFIDFKWVLLIAGSILFIFAYKKQTKFIIKRIKINL